MLKEIHKYFSPSARVLAYSLYVLATWVFVCSCNNDSKYTVASNTSRKVFIKKEQDGSFKLYKNGQPFLVKGAAGNAKIKELVACGGNTISTWDTATLGNILDEALQNNVVVIAGLDIPSGDIQEYYKDKEKVNQLAASYKRIVNKYKNHPALLAWAIGNELIMPFGTGTSDFYDTYNQLLKMIHTDDPDHPVTTTIINFQKGSITNINWKIRDLDFISINTYNKLKEIDVRLKKLKLIWDGPYMISEWSPNGGWESENTVWQAPIENTSTRKAQVYDEFYKYYMPKKDPRFLGSLVFYWGSRQEYTPTWYSVFNEDGTPTEIKETLNDCWKDTVTKHESVKVQYMLVDKSGARDNLMLKGGSVHTASLLLAEEQSPDSLKYKWEILREDWSRWGRTWNNFERPESMKGLMTDTVSQNTSFVCPKKEGPYRIYVTVYNQKGYCATANTPFYVIEE